jgi:hypothetical protein
VSFSVNNSIVDLLELVLPIINIPRGSFEIPFLLDDDCNKSDHICSSPYIISCHSIMIDYSCP